MSRLSSLWRSLSLGAVLALVLSQLMTGVAVAAPGTGALELVSTNAAGQKADFGAFPLFDISSDGSRVAFRSSSTNLVAGVTDGRHRVYVKDLDTGVVVLASSAADGTPANGESTTFSISRNGRYVVFDSTATNLSNADNDTRRDLFVKDLQTGAVVLASTAADGTRGDRRGIAGLPQVSDDGKIVVFATNATFDPAHEAQECYDPQDDEYFDCTPAQVYVKNLVTGQVTLLTDGSQGGALSGTRSLSLTGDGRKLALGTLQQFVAEDTNNSSDIYVIDLDTRQTVRATTPAVGGYFPHLSDDGTRIVFQANGPFGTQPYFRDLTTGSPQLVSTTSDGTVANALSQDPRISGDGTHVSFSSNATNLDPADGDSVADIYLKTLDTGELRLISQTDAGVKSNASSFISAPAPGGNSVIFATQATNLDSRDTDLNEDLYRKVVPQGSDDVDGDGIDDTLQPSGTPAGSFVDDSLEPPTTGRIIDAGGLAVTITDADDPDDGVRITVGEGEGRASFEVCGFTLRLNAGTTAIVTCGSVTVEVVTGRGEIVLGQDQGTVSVPAGATAKVSENLDGSFTVENVGDGIVTVTVAGIDITVLPGESRDVPAVTFEGFAAPVDNNGAVNVVTARATVPMRWRLTLDDQPVTDPATIKWLTSRPVVCPVSTAADEPVEETTTSKSALVYQGDGYWQFNWATSKAWAKTCREFRLTLQDDSVHTALFRFR
jgi:Tol biopolymer transport system component